MFLPCVMVVALACYKLFYFREEGRGLREGAALVDIKNHVVSVLFALRYTNRGLVSIPV